MMNVSGQVSRMTLYRSMEDYFFSSVSQKTYSLGSTASGYLTGVDAGSLNLLIVKQRDPETESIIQEGMRLFDAAGVPFSVVLPDNDPDRIGHSLRELGLSVAWKSSPMQLTMKTLTTQKPRSDDYHICATDYRLEDWGAPLTSAFETDDRVMLQYRMRHQHAVEAGWQLRHFSLFVADRAVCSLTLSMQSGVARLDDVGTRSTLQGRGYASALIRHALEYARSQNVETFFLEASEAGVSIYKRLGFTLLGSSVAFQRE